MFAENAVAHNYVVVQQVSNQSAFLMMPNQRRLVRELTVEPLAKEETLDLDTFENGHRGELVLKHTSWYSTNVLLRNSHKRMTRMQKRKKETNSRNSASEKLRPT